MAEKTEFELSYEDDLPPPYIESLMQLGISEQRSQLLQFISMLPGAARQRQREDQSRREEEDLDHMSRLIPEVGNFLVHVASLPQQPRRAELVMVPDGVVPARWTLSGIEEQRKEGDIVRVAHVTEVTEATQATEATKKMQSKKEKGQHESGMSTEQRDEIDEFDEWGRWTDEQPMAASAGARGWWRDERLARRLAGHLSPRLEQWQPQPQPPRAEPPRYEAAIQVTESQGKTGSWRPWASRRRSAVAAVPVAVPPVDRGKGAGPPGSRITVAARAEQLTFRGQNEFGIYESLTGWGIVLRVTYS